MGWLDLEIRIQPISFIYILYQDIHMNDKQISRYSFLNIPILDFTAVP